MAPNKKTADAAAEGGPLAAEGKAEVEARTEAESERQAAGLEAVGQGKRGSAKGRPAWHDTEALADAGMSAADLEMSTLVGDRKIVKANPEVNTLAEAAAAETEGHPTVAPATVTITDGDGEEKQAYLNADDQALINSRVAASQPTHPNFTSKGHWSNPNLNIDPTEDEVKANEKAYAARIS